MGRTRRARLQREAALADALNAAAEEGRRRTLFDLIKNAALYVLGRERADATRIVSERGLGGALVAVAELATGSWRDRWKTALSPVLGSAMESATRDAAPYFGSFDLANPAMARYLDGYTSELSRTLSDTSYGNFERLLREAQEEGLSARDFSARLEDSLPEVDRKRADLIAATELHSTSEGASLEHARQSGVVFGKTWNHSGKANFRPEHKGQDGATVGLDEPFPDGSQFPHGPNCGCFLTFVVDVDAVRGGAA